MKVAALVALLAAAASPATAIIYAIAAPSEVAQGATIEITLITANYIQSVIDVSAAYGLWPRQPDTYLGQYIGSDYLGPSQSNTLTNITQTVTIPANYPLGQAYLSAAITSLYGAASGPSTGVYSVPVTITADTTSTDLVRSSGGNNVCSPASSSSTTSSTSSMPSTTTLITSTISSTTTSSSATSTSTSSPSANVQTLIQGVQTDLNSLINDIVRGDSSTADADYATAAGLFQQIFAAVAPSGYNCGIYSTPAAPASQSASIPYIQSVQAMLNNLSGDLVNNDSKNAITEICAILAEWGAIKGVFS